MVEHSEKESPEPTRLTPQMFYLMVNDSIAKHESSVNSLQNLMNKAEWGWDNNYLVILLFYEDRGVIDVELREKPGIGFRGETHH